MALVPRVVKVTGKAASGSGSLTALAARVGEMLKKRDRPDGRAPPLSTPPPTAADRRARRAGPETISVFEATTGGLVNAALQSVPGASRYCAPPLPVAESVNPPGAQPAAADHGGANIYGRIGYKLYPKELAQELAKGGATDGNTNYASQKNYHASKVHHTTTISAFMNEQLGSDWCISESGATGPTFAPPDCHTGFTAIALVGPGVSECIIVESDTADREENMWAFTQAAFDLLEQALTSSKL